MCPLETQVLCKNIEKVKNKKLFISICYITKKNYMVNIPIISKFHFNFLLAPIVFISFISLIWPASYFCNLF